MPIAKRCFVAGRVQGVFYRASAQHEARRLHIQGYAKNLSDGRVEVLAIGEPNDVNAFVKWLWQGPPAARVSQVEVSDADVDSVATREFTIA